MNDEKNTVLDLIMSNVINKNDYVELLSACIGKVYSNQIELQEYLGNYQKWNVTISKGELYIDDKKFDVDFLGTTSNSDGMWFNADLEKQILERYMQALFSSYKNIEKYSIGEILPKKVKLDDLYTDHSLAIIYTALSGKNTCYFKGNGDVSIFMIFNNIPENIVKSTDANKFANRTMYIIQNFNVKHRLMIKSFAISNGNEFVEENDSIIVKFTNDSSLIFKFDDKDRLINISGNL